MSSPINKYPSRGDKEQIPMREIPSPVASMSTGVEANHSSTQMSVSGNKGNHTQYNDDELSGPSQGHLDPNGYDPNISGPHPTEPARDWQAGGLSAWQENDDYRDFSTREGSSVAESRLWAPWKSVHDMDYDDNGGYPSSTVDNHSDHEFGSDESAHQGSWGEGMQTSQGSINIEPIIRR